MPRRPASTPRTGAKWAIAGPPSVSGRRQTCAQADAGRCRFAFTRWRAADRLARPMVSQVRILGPIEVELGDDGCARIPRGRTLALLALLLVHRGAIVAVDRIADELWDGDGPQNARNAVQVSASRLRAAVGEELVVSGARGYA